MTRLYNHLMDHRIDLLGPRALLFSWLAALFSFPAALLSAALGQAAGAMIGGCTWIGISLPVDRQIWALVNQPTLNFADSPASHGYWLGSTIVPLLLALGVTLAIHKCSSLAAEILLIQLCWGWLAYGLAWQPLLDRGSGHLVKWLHFNEVSPHAVWLAPALAAMLAVLPALRLLSVLRLYRRGSGAGTRLVTLTLHLFLPTAAVICAATLFGGHLETVAIVAVGSMAIVTIVIAWRRYPSSPYSPLEPIGGFAVAATVAGIVFLGGLVYIAGRPRANDQTSSLLWATPSTSNNIPTWIARSATE